MNCKRCRDFDVNACTDIISSNCVTSQMTAVEELDICLGDSLTWIGNIILAKIKDLLKGKGIILDDLTLDDCAYISDLLGTDEKNLLNVLKAYKEAICELKEQADLTSADIASFASVALYTLGCITLVPDPCGSGPTFKDLIQAIITKLCALDTQFQSIAETILDAVEEGAGNLIIGGAVKSCAGNGITYTGTGATAVATIEALVPPYAPILYTGSLANFDANGVGLPATPLCGWYLCNGNNGTPNSTTLPQNAAGTLKYIIRFT